MKFLAIDYGLSKIGLATSDGYFSHPYKVISHDKWEVNLLRIITGENIGKIIVGVSEGKSGEEAKNFVTSLGKLTSIPLVLWDETLTTHEALNKMITADKSKKYRHDMQDAVAAAIILQSYLENIS